jgi:branched-chain amino acid transport system ATP-binding protein
MGSVSIKALHLEDISLNFGGMIVLNHCHLSVDVGEKRAIIGPNGAGKTTLFNVITGVLSPSKGLIRLLGEDITPLPTHKRALKGLARTFQITNLFPNLSVIENVILGIQALTKTKMIFYRRMASFNTLLDQARSFLADWGLEGKSDIWVRDLSHGEQRQLEIILALSANPKVLLLDEPTQGLSTAETAMIIPMIERLGRSITVLFIEHDMDVAFQLADKITVLYFGQVLAEGTVAEIRNNAKVAEVYLGLEGSHARTC